MIKFFRKIRQNMIKENRTSKYLLYAIGEIVLVVIGILIALSINNWNSSRKDTIKAQSYYKSIKRDLVNDTLLIGEMISENRSFVNYNNNLRNRVHSNNATIDTIIAIAQYEFVTNSATILDFNNNTFETLISSGDFSILNPSTKDALLILDSEQKKTIESISFLRNVYANKLGRYSDSYPVPVRNKKEKTSLEKSIWQQLDKQDFTSRFVSILDLSSFMSFNNIEGLKALKIHTTDILENINQ